MKKFLVALTIILAFSTAIAVPHYLTYQGVLRDNSGNLVTGTKSMSFSIFNTLTGGSAIYGPQTEASVSVSNGNYTVQLGPISSPTTVFDGADKYLEVSVDGTPLAPRLKINAVAYSMRAETADSANAVADNSITASDLQEYAVLAGKIGTSEVTNEKLAGGVTGDKLASNITISTSGNITANTLTITKIATTGAGCVGKGVITAGNNYSAAIDNLNVTNANSFIFITPRTIGSGLTYEALVPRNIIDNTSFRVGFSNSDGAYSRPVDIEFDYLIIN